MHVVVQYLFCASFVCVLLLFFSGCVSGMKFFQNDRASAMRFQHARIRNHSHNTIFSTQTHIVAGLLKGFEQVGPSSGLYKFHTGEYYRSVSSLTESVGG
jgi:hypothetical protein